MATILRSSKHVRNFLELISKVGASRVKCEVYPYHLFLTNSLPSTTLAKPFTVQPSANLLEHHTNVETGDLKLEKILQALDQDVRKFGRISKAKFENALKRFASSRSVSNTQALMMIRCCGNLVSDELPEIRTQWVNKIWKIMKSSGMKLSLSHYNALLRVYVENEYAFSPAEVLAELVDEGLDPNKITYQRLIDRYCQQGDTEGATKILQFMREKEISVNENIFNALIRGHSEAGDIASAAEIPMLMKQAGLEPTPDTYRELLCAYAKHGDIESIFKTIEECRTMNTLLLSSDFLAIVYSLASSGHGEHVSKIMSITPQSFGYIQDAVSTAQKLLNIGQVDIAMQVLQSIPKREEGFTGTAMLRKLSQSSVTPRQLVDMCQMMETNGIHSRAIMTTLEASLFHGNVEASLTLLDLLKVSGEEIREHYFWPILVTLGKSKDDAGVINILYKMKHQYHLPSISGTTLIEWVLPYKTGDPDQIMTELSPTRIPSGSIAAAITHHFISKMKLQEAANFVPKYFFRYNSTYRRPLLLALKHTGDVESFVKILQHMNQASVHQNSSNDHESIDTYVIGIPTYIQEHPPVILTAVLEQIHSAGISLRQETINSLEQMIGSKITPKLSNVLSQFQHGNKSVANTQTSRSRRIQKLENLLSSSDLDPSEALEKKQQLLRLYCASRLMPQVETILQELEKEVSELDEITYSFIIEAYCNSGVLAEAEKYVQILKEKYSVYDLSIGGLFRYMHLLIENDRIDDMLKMASEIQCTQDQQELVSTKWWRLLNELADLGKLEAVNELFELIMQKQSNNISNQMFPALVRVHLARNDTKGALDAFEKIHEKYKCTPMKNELTKQLIKEEDTINLQRVTDLSTQIHGETNSLYDLAQSFIEMDCIRQAQKILEIPALHSKIQRLLYCSQRYSEQGQVKYLENLISTIIDIPNVNTISKFYCDLLFCYDRNNDWQKGLQLWQQMQDADIRPSPDFSAILANLLQRNGQNVPFPITDPKIQQLMSDQSSKHGPNKDEKSESSNYRRQSRRRTDNVINSSQIAEKTQNEEVKKNNETIRQLLDDNKFSEVYELITDSTTPMPLGTKCLQDVFKKLSAAGEVDWIIKFGERIALSRKKVVNYYNSLGYAYVNAGRTEEYLDNLENNVPLSTTEIPENSFGIIPMLCFRDILQKPEFTEKCIKIATKYADQGIIYPMNAIWIQFFIDNHPNVDTIWSEYVIKSPVVRFDNIIGAAVVNNDPDLLKRLIKTLETAPSIYPRSIAKVYSNLISIYNQKAEYENGLTALEDALKTLTWEDLQKNVLENLENGLRNSGKTFPKHIVDQIPSMQRNF